MYYDKWWKSHGRWPDSGNCLKKEFSMKEKAAVNALGVVNIGGVFVVLLVGLAFAVTVAIGEFCWKTSSLNMKVDRHSLVGFLPSKNYLPSGIYRHFYEQQD